MEQVFFEEIQGKKIFCVFSEPNPVTKKIVIMSHGFRGDSTGPARQFVDFQRILNKEGFSVLRFDQSNSGNSDGDYLNSSFNEWINTIVYFAKKYLDQGYEVSLLGQNMGATVAATNYPKIMNKISCILLWVPDPETDFSGDQKKTYEEGGQKYKGGFWQEAKDANFFQCLSNFSGKIHLVYGEIDRYVKKELMDKTKKIVKDKGQEVVILEGQDHSPWEFDKAQEVYKQQLVKLKNNYRSLLSY